MKKSLFALLVLAGCLSACTPAEPGPAGETSAVEETAETATEEAEETQTGTFQVTGALRDVSDATLQEDTLYDI